MDIDAQNTVLLGNKVTLNAAVNQAAVAIRNFGVNSVTKQTVVIRGITFRVPITSRNGKIYVPTAFPINPKTPQ